MEVRHAKLLKLSAFVQVFAWFLGVTAQAAGDERLVPGSRYTSARAAALGDNFLALADDGASGLFYNPAGIGRIKHHTHSEPLNLQIMATQNYFGHFSINSYKVFDLNQWTPTLGGRPGLSSGVGMSILPNFYFRGFALGVLGQSRLYAVHDGTNVRYRSLYQLVPTVGAALRLASGVVRLGYSFQWVNQVYGDVTVDPSTTTPNYREQLRQGSGFSHNVGVALTFPISMLPSITFVGRNLFAVRYMNFSIFPLAQNSPGVPDDDPMTFDTGISLSPKVGKGTQFNIALEWKDLANASGVSLVKRLGAGIEFSFRDQFFLRGGWGRMLPSAGIGLKRKNAEFSLTYAIEDIGTEQTPERDARFMLQYQIRAF